MFPDDYKGRVFVYWDLHRLCWSIRAGGRVLNMEVVNGKRVKVAVHLVCLRACVFAVQQAAREKCLRLRRRTVHAGVYGYLCSPAPEQIETLYRRVRYAPYERGEFFDALTGEAVASAPLALFYHGKVYIGGDHA
jgi:hypothetical protein